jgi:nitrogen fixation/metabolism regulation signal transduction histidine kinase
MNQSVLLVLGLAAAVAVLSVILAYAVIRFIAAARSLAKSGGRAGGEAVFVTTAMEDALRDLRSQERAMKARAEASERLSDEIVASLTSGLLVVDYGGIVRTLNPAGRKLLGLPEGNWTRPYIDVLGGAPGLASLIDECLAAAQPVVRRTVKTVAGGATHLGVTVSPIRDESGHAYGAICLFTDLSEIMDLEDQLRLKDSLARLGELTAGIAHEFRNGLATIHGYARLLDLERLPEDFRPYVSGIRSETEALGQVVTNFLNFAKPTKLILGTVDMATVVDRAADDIRGEVAARGGQMVIRGEFARVDGDDVLLRQAMSNLFRNALEACVDGGITPDISAEGAIDRDQKTLRMVVSDNGPGITSAVAERMFRPFYTTKARGTGLGLALVQKIVVTHNGRVTALSNDRRGARIAVTLPLPSSVSEDGEVRSAAL